MDTDLEEINIKSNLKHDELNQEPILLLKYVKNKYFT